MTPSHLEATCARFRGHYEGDAQNYREQDEDFTSRDPLLIARRALTAAGTAASELDEIEQLLIGLQRAKHITRIEMIQLQARYLHEAKP